MENKAQIMDWTGIWDPWVHLSALPLTCWATLGKLFHLSMHKGPIYKKEVVVHVSVVLNTCVRNAAEKAGFELNKWPSPFQFFMLYHLLVLPCTLGRLLKADGAFSKGSQRVVPLLLLVTKTWLMLLLLILTTADYSLPGLSHFSQFFSLKWSKTLLPKPCPHSPRDTALTQSCIWTSPPSLLACCFLISISPWLNLSAVPNVLPAWLIAWLITSPCLSLCLRLLSQACTSLPGYLQPPLRGGMLLCLATSSSISLAFDNIHASTLKTLHIPVNF